MDLGSHVSKNPWLGFDEAADQGDLGFVQQAVTCVPQMIGFLVHIGAEACRSGVCDRCYSPQAPSTRVERWIPSGQGMIW